jgi:hypothetical protein
MRLVEGKSCGSSDAVELAAGFAFQRVLCVGGCADQQSGNSAIKGLRPATGGPGQSRNQDPCQLDFLYDTNMLDHKRDCQLPDQTEKEGAFHEPNLSRPAL